jgi:hypothetical protein
MRITIRASKTIEYRQKILLGEGVSKDDGGR